MISLRSIASNIIYILNPDNFQNSIFIPYLSLYTNLSCYSHSWISNKHTNLTHLKQNILFHPSHLLLCLWCLNTHISICPKLLRPKTWVFLNSFISLTVYIPIIQKWLGYHFYVESIHFSPATTLSHNHFLLSLL